MAAQTYFMQLRAVVDSLVKCIVSRGLLRGTAGRGSQERMIDAIEASKPIGLQIVFWRCAQRSRLLARIFQASGRLKPSPQCPSLLSRDNTVRDHFSACFRQPDEALSRIASTFWRCERCV